MAEKCSDKRQTNAPTQTAQQTDGQKFKQTLAAQVAKAVQAATATMSIKGRLNFKPTNLARMSEISQTEYMRQVQI